jgi:hypothetical protein
MAPRSPTGTLKDCALKGIEGGIEGTGIEGTDEVTTILNSLGVCDECGYFVCPFNASLVPQ